MTSLTEPLSVKQLSDILKGCFSNPIFSNITVYGEVYSIKNGKYSYIEIGDQGNKQVNSPIIKCGFATFYGNSFNLDEIKTGDIIQVKGKLSYYPHGSSITLWGDEITLLQSQLGKNLLLKRETLKKLDELGYLDESRKRKIPKYVKKVAILTAKEGAAYQDILNTLHKRFPCSTILYPITVQGNSASKSIIEAMKKANDSDCDIIILGRGGGSKTDLSCFDDEKVSLSIAKSKLPVITCIGHTIDTSIADRVSDKSAITPTEGASLINPSIEEVNNQLSFYKDSLNEKMLEVIKDKRRDVGIYYSDIEKYSLNNILKSKRENIDSLKKNLQNQILQKIKNKKMEIKEIEYNYKNSMLKLIHTKQKDASKYQIELQKYDSTWMKENGYSLIFQDGKKVKSILELKKDSEVTITYYDGHKKAIIKE